MTVHPDVPPVYHDRPVVDGRDRSSDDLRAEVRQHSDSDLVQAQRNARELRGELEETVAELAARLDLRARVPDTVITTARAHTDLRMRAVAVVLFAVVTRRVRSAIQ